VASGKTTEKALTRTFGSHQSQQYSVPEEHREKHRREAKCLLPNFSHIFTPKPTNSSFCIWDLPKSLIKGCYPMLRISLSLSVSF
jgi:hypothetical protein